MLHTYSFFILVWSRLIRWTGTLNKKYQISEQIVFQKVIYNVMTIGTVFS